MKQTSTLEKSIHLPELHHMSQMEVLRKFTSSLALVSSCSFHLLLVLTCRLCPADLSCLYSLYIYSSSFASLSLKEQNYKSKKERCLEHTVSLAYVPSQSIQTSLPVKNQRDAQAQTCTGAYKTNIRIFTCKSFI